jgi:DNA-binding NarL/FixJ family response regulator
MIIDLEQKPTILVVDDDKEVLFSFKIWLSSEEFRVITVENSVEALKVLETETVSVVLLDFRLGTENGLQVAQQLKDVDENLKIIIITGYPSYDTAVETIKSGFFDYLSKGSSNEKIMETIKKAIHSRERETLATGVKLPPAQLLKFIVVCKHSLIKERLKNFADNYPRVKLISTFESINQLTTRKYLPETDIAMICASCCFQSFDHALTFFNKLYKMIPNIKPVLFNHKFTEYEKVELIKIGIKGFFAIEMDSENLDKALSMVKKGSMWVNRKLVNMALPDGREYLKDQLIGVESCGLSEREKEILKAMVLGLKNKEIADKLFISEVTVKSHLHRIFKKLNVNNRTKAIRMATEKRII